MCTVHVEKEEDGQNVIFGTAGFSAVSLHNDGRSRCKITRRTRLWRLEVLKVYRSLDISVYIMYYNVIYVTSGPSLLRESTDSMISRPLWSVNKILRYSKSSRLWGGPAWLNTWTCTCLIKVQNNQTANEFIMLHLNNVMVWSGCAM